MAKSEDNAFVYIPALLIIITIGWAAWRQIAGEFGLPSISWLTMFCGYLIGRLISLALFGMRRGSE